MINVIGALKDAEIKTSPGGGLITIVLTEKDGNFYGSKSEIKMPEDSYETLERAIVDRWLEKKKDNSGG